ncbi:MAG: hypothetical protein R3F22_01925 [Lysobacteraceae bacterium]
MPLSWNETNRPAAGTICFAANTNRRLPVFQRYQALTSLLPTTKPKKPRRRKQASSE